MIQEIQNILKQLGDWGISLRLKKIRFTLFQELIAYFAIFSVIVLVALYSANYVSNMMFDKYSPYYMVNQFDSVLDKLQSGKYKSIDFEKLLSKSVKVDIVTEMGDVVYSNYNRVEKYNPSDFYYIYSYKSPYYVNMVPFVENGEDYVNITIEYFDASEVNKSYVLNDSNEVVSSNDDTKERFTREELDYLSNDTQIGKYEFIGNDGITYYLISILPESVLPDYSNIFKTIDQIYLGLQIFYVILVIQFVWLVHRKILKLIKKLNEAIYELTAFGSSRVKNYRGPKEFEEIADNFNIMAKSLDESRQQQIRLEEDKKKLLSDISHDLKTPITVIQGYAEAIADNMVDDNSKQEYLRIISKKAGALTDLINKFYEYNKLDHPDFKLKCENVEIKEFVREYLADKYDEIIHKGLDLKISIDGKKQVIELDKLQMKRVLDNIIDNAIKHNPPGITIHVQIIDEEKTVCIVIEDNGVGISDELRAHIFDPFVVTDDSRSSGGSGLGLTISKKIIDNHQGTIEVKKTDSYKTRFEIRLNKKY